MHAKVKGPVKVFEVIIIIDCIETKFIDQHLSKSTFQILYNISWTLLSSEQKNGKLGR